jgi:hypothetical protein
LLDCQRFLDTRYNNCGMGRHIPWSIGRLGSKNILGRQNMGVVRFYTPRG